MRLGRRIILTTGLIVVITGLVTVGVLHTIVSQALGEQLDQNGLATARLLANDLANPLLDGDELVVSRNLNRFRQEGPSVVYAYAVTPDQRRVIHTLPDGFPSQLFAITRLPDEEQQTSIRRLETEQGLVRDYGVRLLDGLDAEVHVGLAEVPIVALRRGVTLLIAGLTGCGVLLAILLSWVLGRYVAGPLERFTAVAETVGKGQLDQEIRVSSRDEVGDLANSFNRMVVRLRDAIEQERSRNRELSALNAVSRIVSSGEDLTGLLAQALDEVKEALGLQGAWIVLTPDPASPSGEVAAAVGVDLARPTPGPERAVMGPIPLVSGGRSLGYMNVLLGATTPISSQDEEMLLGIGRQLGGALERMQLWQRLSDRENRVSQLLQKVIDAQEEERKRIARELHDDTSQSMAAITVGLKATASLVRRDPERAESYLEGLKESMAQSLREIHNIVYDLRPTLLDDRGLVPALHWCASQRLSAQGVAVEVTAGGLQARTPPQVETTLFRIGQEAITNVAKHARAANLRISVQTDERRVLMSIADDGCGFDEEAAPDGREKRPLGLMGMAERASLLGGSCTIRSVPREGTRIDVEIPLEGGVRSDHHSAG